MTNPWRLPNRECAQTFSVSLSGSCPEGTSQKVRERKRSRKAAVRKPQNFCAFPFATPSPSRARSWQRAMGHGSDHRSAAAQGDTHARPWAGVARCPAFSCHLHDFPGQSSRLGRGHLHAEIRNALLSRRSRSLNLCERQQSTSRHIGTTHSSIMVSSQATTLPQ